MTARTPHLALVVGVNGGRPSCRHIAVWRANEVERVLPAGKDLVCIYSAGGDVIWLEADLVRQLHWHVEHPRQSWPDAARATTTQLAEAPDRRNVSSALDSEVLFAPLGRLDYLLFAIACLAMGAVLAALKWNQL